MKQLHMSFAPSATPLGPVDVMCMATALVDKHGDYAVKLAEFSANEHKFHNDPARLQAWVAVTTTAEDILSGRLPNGRLIIH